MKKIILVIAVAIAWAGCAKTTKPNPVTDPPTPPPVNNPPDPTAMQITSVSPTYGYTDDVVQIGGKNFGTDINAVTAKINGVAATIFPNSFGDISCSIRVPAKCGSGAITLTKAGKTVTVGQFFYIPSNTVTTVYGKQDASSFTNGTGTSMRLGTPADFVFDKHNNIYVADRGGTSGTTPGSLIRKIAANGAIGTYSGGPLGGNTANYTTLWSVGLPGGSGGNSDVNGGEARFNLPSGIGISEDPNSDAFKLFVTQNNFIRIINEFTATGVFAGNVKDTFGGGNTPNVGGAHEAHIFPLGAPVIVPNPADYGSPTIYWADRGPRLAKLSGGNVTTVVDLTSIGYGFLVRSPDGNLFMSPGPSTKKIYKITTQGQEGISTWISDQDSVLNRATGKNESFGAVEAGSVVNFATDKDNNLFFMTYSSSYTTLYKFFPDKSFIRLYAWYHKFTAADGVNGNADLVQPWYRMIVRDNGDIYFTDGSAIRKITLE